MRTMVLAAGLAWLALATPTMGANEDGAVTGCDIGSLQKGWKIIGGRRVYQSEDNRAIAHQLETPVYTSATGSARAPRTLKFSEYVLIAAPGDGAARIPVKDDALQPLGWVNRNDVLCRSAPLTDPETGLYRRAVVRTATDIRGNPQEKEVYHSLDRRCEGSTGQTRTCTKVSRFQWYFVYAEIQGHYLIGEWEVLSSSTRRLVGWLPVGDALNWNTALGLRPSDKLPDDKFVCAYRSVNDFNARTGCNEVLGGKRWFNLDTRIAVLKEDSAGRFYDVAFSNAFQNADAQGRDPTAAVDALKKLDVFFVIDGTKSMQPAIDGVRGIVRRLNEKIRARATQDGVIRFGFRVYRDSIKGKEDGVSNSERLVLSNTCDKSTEERDFTNAFRNVKAFEPPGDDDFPENAFGGLMQASADIAACRDHTKLVFVIGDHGYDAEKQRQRGHTAYSEAEVSKAFKRGTRFNTQPIVIFIQTPSELASTPAVAKERYELAYKAFESQGNKIIKGIYEGTPNRSPLSVITLQPGSISDEVVQRVVTQVDTYLRADVFAMVTEGLRAGESLVQIIERLRANSALNIPIRLLEHVEASVCERLGERCRTSVLETVSTAVMGRVDDLIPEVMMTKEQLEKWMEILSKFNAALSRMLPMRDRRTLIVNALLKEIGDVLQINLENTAEGLSKALQFRAGIPEAGNSKLMAYAPDELESPQKVPVCEIDYLVSYAARKHEILKMILDGEGLVFPDYREEPLTAAQCVGISEKGKNIPQIRGQIHPNRLNEQTGRTNYTFRRANRDQQPIYWIPVRYLP